MPSYTISDGDWLDTAIDVIAGQVLRFSAEGTWAPVDPSFGTPGEFSNVGPGGYPNYNQRFSGDSYTNLTDIGSGITNGDLLSQHTNWGAVVGFIALNGEIPPGGGSYAHGDATIAEQATRVFLIKESLTYTVPAAGRLYIAQNDDAYSATSGDNSGSVDVVITSQIDVRCSDIITAARVNKTRLGVAPATSGMLQLEFYRDNIRRLIWPIAPRFGDGTLTSNASEDIGSIISLDSNNNLYVPLWTDATTGRRVVKFITTNGIMALDDTTIWWQADTLERCLAVSVDEDDNVWVLVSTGDSDPFSATGLKLYKLTTAGVTVSSVSLSIPSGHSPGAALAGADIYGETYYIGFFDVSPQLWFSYNVNTGAATQIYSSTTKSTQGLKTTLDGRVTGALFATIAGEREYLAMFLPSGQTFGLTSEGANQSSSLSDGINLYEPGKVIVSREETTQAGIVLTTVRKIYSVDLDTYSIKLLFSADAGTSGNSPLVRLCPRRKRRMPQATLVGAT